MNPNEQANALATALEAIAVRLRRGDWSQRDFALDLVGNAILKAFDAAAEVRIGTTGGDDSGVRDTGRRVAGGSRKHAAKTARRDSEAAKPKR